MKKNLSVDEQERRSRNNRKVALYGCLPLVCIFGVIMIIAAIVSSAEDSKPDTSVAYIVSKEYVKRQLEFPAEAQFGYLPVLSEVQEGTDGIYRVVGNVTVKNAFGVKKEIRYLCRLRYISGDPLNPASWELVDLSL